MCFVYMWRWRDKERTQNILFMDIQKHNRQYSDSRKTINIATQIFNSNSYTNVQRATWNGLSLYDKNVTFANKNYEGPFKLTNTNIKLLFQLISLN